MTARVVTAVVLALVGLVWIGQGLGFIGGSPMTDDMRWTWVGIALLAVAVILAWTTRRRT